jgi:hypothetical protein
LDQRLVDSIGGAMVSPDRRGQSNRGLPMTKHFFPPIRLRRIARQARLVAALIGLAVSAGVARADGIVTYLWTTTNQGSGSHLDQPTIASFDIPLAVMLSGRILPSDVGNIQLAYPGLTLTSFTVAPVGPDFTAYVNPFTGELIFNNPGEGLRIEGYQGGPFGDTFLSITFDAAAFDSAGQPLFGLADHYEALNSGQPYSGSPTAGYWTPRIVIIDNFAPEPASWAMMAWGFGLIGGALRLRRKAAVRFG